MDSSSKEILKCCVENCKNTTRNCKYKFYSFPTANPNYPHKVQKRELWLKALKKLGPDGSAWTPQKRSRICSIHFAGNKKSEHPESPSYIPTVFEYSTRTSNRATSSANRFQRFLKRRIQNSAVFESYTKKSKISDTQKLFPNFSLQNENPTYDQATCDVETNINFLSDDENNTDNFHKNHIMFICINHRNSNFSDAETQIYIPRKDKVNFYSSTSKTVKCAKTPEACTTGFHGYSPVKDKSKNMQFLL